LVVVPAGVSATFDGFYVHGGWAVSPSTGAGMLSSTTQALTIANCRFSRNDASSGSALAAVGSPIVLNCTFSDNRDVNAGGAILAQGPGNFRLVNSVLNGNYSDVDGGAIFATTGVNLTMTNCTVVGNWARGGRGGGLFL